MITFNISYDGSDAEIMQALSRMVSAFGAVPHTDSSNSPSQPSSDTQDSTERIANKFCGNVCRNPRLKKVMEVWLKRDGRIPLKELVATSGVKTQHDYAGIGSALTRNMKKAGGAKDWYDGHQDMNGEWVYVISQHLVKPLRKAFHV